MRVRVHLVAAGPPGERRPPASAAVVIDVLRATTTLTMARLHGVASIHAVATPAEALSLRQGVPGAVLGGERDGRVLPGFDLGNSPAEYDAAAVGGRPLIFASTNGSIAMLRTASAGRRLLAAFINLAAVVDRLAGEPEVWIVAAGKLGRFAIEDAACAGLLCARLRARGATLLGPEAALASAVAPGDAAGVRALVEGCAHARYLRGLGPAFAEDVRFCAGLDTLDAAFEV